MLGVADIDIKAATEQNLVSSFIAVIFLERSQTFAPILARNPVRLAPTNTVDESTFLYSASFVSAGTCKRLATCAKPTGEISVTSSGAAAVAP
jgi:hypothetical protein